MVRQKAIVFSLAEYVECILEYKESQPPHLFRGQASEDWDLTPSAARHSSLANNYEEDIGLFKSLGAALFSRNLDMPEWAALAQHHGIATHLLDWSTNPLIALYFAAEAIDLQDPSTNGSVFVLNPSEVKPWMENADGDGIYLYRPSGISPRIVSQQSCFTLHRPVKVSLKSRDTVPTVDEIVIHHTGRDRISSELRLLGVHAPTVFPDLNGIALYIAIQRRRTMRNISDMPDKAGSLQQVESYRKRLERAKALLPLAHDEASRLAVEKDIRSAEASVNREESWMKKGY